MARTSTIRRPPAQTARATPGDEQARIARWRRIAPLAIIAAVIGFYFWTAQSEVIPYRWNAEPYPYDFYNQLTDGFSSGHLYLALQPRAQLLALRDPYDPDANVKLRLHDASLYRSHYYLYWGPAPAITLYWPFLLLTGTHLPEPFGTAVFGAGAFLAACALLRAMARRLGLRPALWQQALSLTVLAFCAFTPYALRRPWVYECAILAGSFFLLWGFYFWLRAMAAPEGWKPALVAGTCFGLAAGSRPHFALLATAAVGLTAVYLWRGGSGWRALLDRRVVAVAAPVAICGLALLWYNYARFSDPLEFGVTYQLSGESRAEGVRPTIAKFLAGLYYFLIAPVHTRDYFPFLKMPGLAVFERWNVKGEYVESVAGLFTTTPLYILGFFLPWFRLGRLFPGDRAVRWVAWWMWGGAMAVFLILCPLGWATLRYEIDFAPEWLVLSLLAVAVMLERLKTPRTRQAAVAAAVAACAFGIAVNTGLGFLGPGDVIFERYSPRAFDRAMVASRFMPGATGCVSSIEWETAVRFPVNPAAGHRILVFGSGAGFRTNSIWLEFVSESRFRFRYEQGGGAAEAWSQEREYQGGTGNRILVRYDDAQRRLGVTINFGPEEAWATRAMWFPPVNAHSALGVQVVDRRLIPASGGCGFMPQELPMAGCLHGICGPAGSPNRVVYWGNPRQEFLEVGDELRFAGSGSRRIVLMEQSGPLCFITVDGELDFTADGYPHRVGRPAL